MATHLKTCYQLCFYIAFIIFSSCSIREFVPGRTEYELIQEKDEKLPFPDITLCPSQPANVYLKTEQMEKDFNRTFSGFGKNGILPFLFQQRNLSSILETYSYTMAESLISIDFW